MNELIKENYRLIICVLFICILIFSMLNPSILANFLYHGHDENPFDKMRESEREVKLEGKLSNVIEYNDFYDGVQPEVYVEIGYNTYQWVNWEYDKLKQYEGKEVIIYCYTNDCYMYYSLTPVSFDFEMGYIEII